MLQNISPRAALRHVVHPATSQASRNSLSKNKSSAFFEFGSSPKNNKSSNEIHVPRDLKGQVKLYKELMSPKHKHSTSTYSFQHLSTSINDISAQSFIKEHTSPLGSPTTNKLNQSVRLNTSVEKESASRVKLPKVPTSPKSGSQLAKSPRLERTLRVETTRIEETKLQTEEDDYEGNPADPILEKEIFSPTSAIAKREELKKGYTDSLGVKVDNEAVYFDNIKNLDTCGVCLTNCKKHLSSPFKVNKPMVKASTYVRDFQNKKLTDEQIMIKNEVYEIEHPHVAVSFKTTNKTDFKDFKPKFHRQDPPENWIKPDDSPMVGRTSYNSEYYDTQAVKIFNERFPQQKTVLQELPFKGASSYKETHNLAFESKGPVSRFFKSKDTSPFLKGIPMKAETTNHVTFKAFKLAESPRAHPIEMLGPNIPFASQFKSTYKKDFLGNQPNKCAAKSFIEHNLPPSKHMYTYE